MRHVGCSSVRTRKWTTLAAVLAVFVVTGCGSSSEGDVKSTVTDYANALANADGTKACSLLSSTARAPFDRFGRGQTCATLLSTEAKAQLTPTVKKNLKSLKVTKVKVNGNTAVATVAIPGRTSTIPLIKEGGKWKIQAPVGTG